MIAICRNSIHTALFLIAVFSASAFAISNIEDQRPGPPVQGFSGTVEASVAGKTGNNKEKDRALASKLNYRRADDLLLLIASAEYGSTREVKDTDEAFLHLRWVRLISEHIAAELFTQWEEDEFANLASRVLLGGGGRFTVAGKEDVYALALGVGAFKEMESLNLQTYEQDTETWRINTYYAYTHRLNDRTTIASTTYLQPNAEDFDDLRALFTFNLTVNMTDTLALRLAYQAKYDSQPAQNLAATPPIDNSKVNTEYVTSLVYSF